MSKNMHDAPESYEENTKVFMLKIWLEGSHREGKVRWRGYITNVIDGNRRYIEDLFEIFQFIVPYLEGLGVKIGWFWRLRIWMKQKKRNYRYYRINQKSDENELPPIS
jgi:hypothetical protein